MAYQSAVTQDSRAFLTLFSYAGHFQEMLNLIPVQAQDASHLGNSLEGVLDRAERLGLHVVAVVCDNTKVNNSGLRAQCGPQLLASDPLPESFFWNGRPIFTVIDPVHNLKNFRNNWLNKVLNGIVMWLSSLL